MTVTASDCDLSSADESLDHDDETSMASRLASWRLRDGCAVPSQCRHCDETVDCGPQRTDAGNGDFRVCGRIYSDAN